MSGNALAMTELSSIAAGINTADAMVKAAQVELVFAQSVCPGKYICVVHGAVGEAQSALAAGIKTAGQFLVDKLFIANVDPQLCPAITMTTRVKPVKAVGVLEFFSVTAAISAADTAVKAAQVRLIEIRTGYATGGNGFVTLTGEVGAVRAAVEAAAKAEPLLLNSVVIPKPAPQLVEKLL